MFIGNFLALLWLEPDAEKIILKMHYRDYISYDVLKIYRTK